MKISEFPVSMLVKQIFDDARASVDPTASAKNPAKQKDAEHLAPSDILKQIRTKEKLVSGLLDEIEDLLAEK